MYQFIHLFINVVLLSFIYCEPASTTDSSFIVPVEISQTENGFRYQGMEYVMINIPLSHSLAATYCTFILNADLARITTLVMANFMAEALSETNINHDNLWVGGVKHKDDSWWWNKMEKPHEAVDPALFENYMFKRNGTELAANTTRNCLAFARKDHDVPQYVDLNCKLARAFICEKIPKEGANETTHDGWIVIGNRQYKIFSEHLPHSTANLKCSQHHAKASLAVVPNPNVAAILGRHLLIGRPSLENAWIGAIYNAPDGWQFPNENMLLPDARTEDPETKLMYPPWRSDTPKHLGCGLLDRHLDKTVLFIEARCDRLRAYICYRIGDDEADEGYDFRDFADYDYRLYMSKLPWYDAKDRCLQDGGKLAEPLNDKQIEHFVYIMGEGKDSTKHIWIGGTYLGNKWVYDSNNETISALSQELYIANTTFHERAEHMNTCFNLDRENHNLPLLYGTDCFYPQRYLCQFEKGKLPSDIIHFPQVFESSYKVPMYKGIN